jgi:hypothetical protein
MPSGHHAIRADSLFGLFELFGADTTAGGPATVNDMTREPSKQLSSDELQAPARAPSRLARWVGTAVAGGALALLWPATEAHAQTAAEPNQVTGTAKGIVGGAFLGAEVVMIPMGAAGLKPWWPYLVFGGLGSVGGAIGGWAVEQAVADTGPAEAPLYMLAGGLALVIPTLVLTLNATTKSEFEGEEEDPSVTPPSDGDQPGTAPGTAPVPGVDTSVTVQKTSMRKRKARPTVPLAMVDMQGGQLRLGLPSVQVRNKYSETEMAEFGVEQRQEYHVPVFRTAF